MTRAIGEIEHGVAGQVRRVGKAGDRRQRRREPVAMTKRRALMVNSSTVTLRRR